MSITELIAELERKRDVAKEEGHDPSKVYVYIPTRDHKRAEWSEVADSHFMFVERGTMIELRLTE